TCVTGASVIASDALYFVVIFFLNAMPTTEIYTLSLHDALPIFDEFDRLANRLDLFGRVVGDVNVELFFQFHHQLDGVEGVGTQVDRKSTRLNSSHVKISYAVFCLKKKKNTTSKHMKQLPSRLFK